MRYNFILFISIHHLCVRLLGLCGFLTAWRTQRREAAVKKKKQVSERRQSTPASPQHLRTVQGRQRCIVFMRQPGLPAGLRPPAERFVRLWCDLLALQHTRRDRASTPSLAVRSPTCTVCTHRWLRLRLPGDSYHRRHGPHVRFRRAPAKKPRSNLSR
jgi:hypothetical protein